MPVIKQNLDGSLGIQGSQLDDGQFVPVSIEWLASSVDKVHFVATRPYKVKSITARVEVAGTDAGAVSAVIKKVASGTAIASGTALHSGSINLKGTAATNQVLTVTEADADIPAGTAIGIDFTGTLTAATGAATVTLVPK
jgi:hypothetical protein